MNLPVQMKPQSLLVVFLIASGSLLLGACGSKTAANEKNFTAALKEHFDKQGDLLLFQANRFLGEKTWPVDVTDSDIKMQKFTPNGIAAQMEVLEALGLAKSTEVEKEVKNEVDIFASAPVKTKVKRYTLTDAAKPFWREIDHKGIQFLTDQRHEEGLCWGKQVLDKVVKWQGPMKLGEYQEVVVFYTDKIEQIPDWAQKPELQAAFRSIKEIMGSTGIEKQIVLDLSSKGWEVKGD